MPSPNTSELVAFTMRNRSTEVADNTSRNNALLAWLMKSNRIRTVDGGSSIEEEIQYADNTNAGWYSGYDELPIGAQQTGTTASFPFKQAVVPVVISGLEKLQNSGKEKVFDLLEQRLENAEFSMRNLISEGIYSDGMGAGGKQISGLEIAIPPDPTVGTYGNISRADWTFWRPTVVNAGVAATPDNVQAYMGTAYHAVQRGADRPDLIIAGTEAFAAFEAKMSSLQRFTSADTAESGFTSYKFLGADVVLDGGQGGFCPSKTMFFLNTRFISFRPHKQRNMVPSEARSGVNQDAEVIHLFWAGNLTSRGQRFQGRLIFA